MCLKNLISRSVKAAFNETLFCDLSLTRRIVFTGKQEAAEATLEALKVVPEPLGKWASILLEVCAYAGEMLSFHSSCSDVTDAKSAALSSLRLSKWMISISFSSFQFHFTLLCLFIFFLQRKAP